MGPTDDLGQGVEAWAKRAGEEALRIGRGHVDAGADRKRREWRQQVLQRQQADTGGGARRALQAIVQQRPQERGGGRGRGVGTGAGVRPKAPAGANGLAGLVLADDLDDHAAMIGPEAGKPIGQDPQDAGEGREIANQPHAARPAQQRQAVMRHGQLEPASKRPASRGP